MTERFSDIDRSQHRPRPDAVSTNGRSPDASSGPSADGLAILLVDDNAHIAASLDLAVRLAGHGLDTAAGVEEALSRLAARRYDAILLDMNYAPGRTDGSEGLALLTRILADDPHACVVVVTAHSGIRIAVEAMRAGARDFVMKPWRNADLLAKLEAAARRGAAPAAPTAATAPAAAEPARLLGDSPAIGRVRDLVRRIGPTRAGVVVTGPPGSGRTLVAAAVHAASADAATPLVRIDLRDPEAWHRIATGPLLLRHPDRLDAVGQARLLDRLPADARCIAVADDARAIGAALARHIAAVEIAVPPLAERGGDAVLLARHFARTFARRHGRPAPTLSAAAEAAVLAARWTDEVRGLASAIERAVLLGDGAIDAAHLLPPDPAGTATAAAPPASTFDLEERERATIASALREHRHNVTHAAAALGLSRGALYRRMERHGL